MVSPAVAILGLVVADHADFSTLGVTKRTATKVTEVRPSQGLDGVS
jgi:hypothetical protein